MTKFAILLLLLCLIFISFKKANAQKKDTLYLRFDRRQPEMDIVSNGEGKNGTNIFRYKMIDEGGGYKKTILKYTGKKWQGAHKAIKDNYTGTPAIILGQQRIMI